MTTHSRIQPPSDSGLPDIQNFAEFCAALRGIAADAETQRLTDGMSELSASIAQVCQALPSDEQGGAATLGPRLVELLATLRKHRLLMVNLPPSWQTLTEYRNYLQALNNLRLLASQWLVERNIKADKAVIVEDFETIGWRTLGEGLIMLDMHEQSQA